MTILFALLTPFTERWMFSALGASHHEERRAFFLQEAPFCTLTSATLDAFPPSVPNSPHTPAPSRARILSYRNSTMRGFRCRFLKGCPPHFKVDPTRICRHFLFVSYSRNVHALEDRASFRTRSTSRVILLASSASSCGRLTMLYI